MEPRPHVPFWRTRGGVALLGFLAVAAFYLITEHAAHVFGALPYLLLLACPLMHLFMHHGHGHREADGRAAPDGGGRGRVQGGMS
ncbi:DUF2933 domain-containing protein [Roseicella frigidaeris]|uniref:DUF2933 domain-containing protein n=1 Tax=Roseicella frigidaeris TaxID=2230885 RepID=A0A327LZE2_9PROT|nr:DUF2933 domain-containing protein [Roseicella frigidaeris]RAI55232.1 hypothetical protein DOO78_24585 [Roseicella frigidaeris]